MSRHLPLPIAALDSSVLVPTWSRISLQRLATSPNPPFVPVWSEWIIAETWRVLTWRWLARGGRPDDAEWRRLTESANGMLRFLLAAMRLVSVRDFAGPPPWPELRNQNDVPIWATAVVGQAQFVISHNVRDFPPLDRGRHVHQGIEYLTTIEFIEGVLGRTVESILGTPPPVGAAIRSGRAPQK